MGSLHGVRSRKRTGGSQSRLSGAVHRVVQIGLVGLVIVGASLRNLERTDILPFSLPELQGLCPLGAVQNIGRFLSGGLDFESGGAWVLTGLIGMALIMGAVFCGRLCPFGTIQEWIGRLGRRALGRRFNRLVSSRVDVLLGKLRYLVMGVVVLTGAGLLGLALDLVNPSYALVHAWTTAVPWSALVVALLVLVGSLFVERPWCRWLCPLGAVQGSLGMLSPLTIRRNTELCIKCGRCNNACPFAVEVSSVKAVRDDRCNRCTRCVEACPVDGALSYGTGRGFPPLSPVFAGVAALVLLLLPFGAFSIATVTDSAQATEGTESLWLSPMMTVAEAAAAAGMEGSELLQLLDLEPTFDLDLALIDIEEEKGFEHVTFGHIRDVLGTR